MVGTADGVANWPPASITDIPITLTANSTVQYVVETCLANQGYNVSEADFQFALPDDVLAALKNGTDYGGLWAPNLYLFLESSEGSGVVCSGKDAGATVPGGIMVRKKFGDANGETVAKALAAWLRGIEFIKDESNREQVLTYMKEYYAIYNVSISDETMGQEIDSRPIFGLDEQLFNMKRQGDANSTVDTWYSGVSNYMFLSGILDEDPLPETYITDKYMQMVANDTELRLFALRENSTEVSSSPATTRSKLIYSAMSGIVFVATFGLM